jgi:hypothetical protein
MICKCPIDFDLKPGVNIICTRNQPSRYNIIYSLLFIIYVFIYLTIGTLWSHVSDSVRIFSPFFCDTENIQHTPNNYNSIGLLSCDAYFRAQAPPKDPEVTKVKNVCVFQWKYIQQIQFLRFWFRNCRNLCTKIILFILHINNVSW